MTAHEAIELVSAPIRSQSAALQKEFRQAYPFPHLVMDNFLEPDYCRELIAAFPRFDKQLALNEYGVAGLKAVNQNLANIGPAYAALDRLLAAPRFLALLSEITGIPGLLYDPDYIGGGTHENLSGQGLDAHVDFNYHPRTGTHRRLNLLLYLNPEWEESWGGALDLHLNPWLPADQNRIKSVLPLANRCVLFETSERSWHGFRNIEIPRDRNISRKSIAVYFYSNERPAAETAPEHSTVYVHPKLPAEIAAGYTLQPRDVETLRNLIERRDLHMRFLYDREKLFSADLAELSSTIRRISRSPAFRIARLLTWPVRALRRIVESRR